MRHLALVALIVAACAACATPGASRTINGTFQLHQTDSVARVTGSPDCQGTGAYSDIRTGAPVIVKDDAGKIIGTGVLTALPAATNGNGQPEATEFLYCRYTFVVAGLPDSPFYSIEVSHRGAITKSREALAAVGWTVDLTLG